MMKVKKILEKMHKNTFIVISANYDLYINGTYQPKGTILFADRLERLSFLRYKYLKNKHICWIDLAKENDDIIAIRVGVG